MFRTCRWWFLMDDEFCLFRGWPILTEKVSLVVGAAKVFASFAGSDKHSIVISTVYRSQFSSYIQLYTHLGQVH
jgi:hypothetical protein